MDAPSEQSNSTGVFIRARRTHRHRAWIHQEARKTPEADLELARKRMNEMKES
jgi:phage-related protein